MSNLVTIFGGSGFVGRYVARRMAKEGWRVRVACRRPNQALFVRTYGAVGQVEPVFCNIRDDASVQAALSGASAAVNCVGTFDSGGANNFDAVQSEAAGRIARLATAGRLSALVQISALGADVNAVSDYSRTKAEGEAAVLAAFPNAMILRPSVIFGNEDGFFNRFAAMARMGPILPLVGGATRFQPVSVEDVAAAAVKGVTSGHSGVYELGGPDVATLYDLVKAILSVIQRRRLVINLPFWVGSVVAGLLGAGSALTLGLVRNTILTSDQVRSLKVDSVVHDDARTLADLGITPTGYAAVIPEYLWRYRPSGQFAAIKNSAKNLKKA
jgi:NADH dehydrogenase